MANGRGLCGEQLPRIRRTSNVTDIASLIFWREPLEVEWMVAAICGVNQRVGSLWRSALKGRSPICRSATALERDLPASDQPHSTLGAAEIYLCTGRTAATSSFFRC
jgi:hypothetical protein